LLNNQNLNLLPFVIEIRYASNRFRVQPSSVEIPNSPTEPDEHTHLLRGIRPSSKQVYDWTNTQLKRTLVLNVLPVAVVDILFYTIKSNRCMMF